MKHLGTNELDTFRLKLRKFILEDAQMMYDNFASIEEDTRYLLIETHKSIDETTSKIEAYLKYSSFDDYYFWGIVLKETNQLFGYIRVINIDEEKECMEIEYCTGSAFWNNHYTSEALGAVLKYLFLEVGVNFVRTKHPIDNAHSGRVMKRCGFEYIEDCMYIVKNKEEMYRIYELTKEKFLNETINLLDVK